MGHTAELIAVGTELLLGNIANTDAQIFNNGSIAELREAVIAFVNDIK